MIVKPICPALVVLMLALPAMAQDKGTLDPHPLPPLANPNDPKTPAKQLFGRRATPAAQMESHVIGFYSKGCLAGAEALPINGPTWQVMRLSRNRNWGHPELIRFLKRLSAKGAKLGWPGLLVGVMSQPRGGPMITGHASHQVGLDADIWLTPMPKRELTRAERRDISPTIPLAPTPPAPAPSGRTPPHPTPVGAAPRGDTRSGPAGQRPAGAGAAGSGGGGPGKRGAGGRNAGLAKPVTPDFASLHPGYQRRAPPIPGNTWVYFTCSSAKLDSIE